MKHFGAFEAKTHFSELLANVMKGDKFVITRHGVEVAMIIPFSKQETEADSVNGAIQSLKRLRKNITLGKGLSIRKMMEQGRK